MKVIWVRVQTLSTGRYMCKAKSAISNGNPKSDYSDMEVFRE